MKKNSIDIGIEKYSIYFTETIEQIKISLKEIINVYNPSKLFLICDINVYNIYKSFVNEMCIEMKAELLNICCLEEKKNIDTVSAIYDFLIEKHANRDSMVIALGGGIAGDIVGFACSTYMRGIKFINVPTTLISQTDSSVGGKVGYNYKDIKNSIGAFYNPKAVIICIDFIKTLPEEQFKSGLGEVIKYSLIYDKEMLNYMETNYKDILNISYRSLSYLIKNCVEIKRQVVTEDFKDEGLRNILNFGHSIGHAIEVDSHYSISHGEAVALGILVALKISEGKFNLDKNLYSRIVNLYANLGIRLNYDISNYDEFMNALRHDKKNDQNIRFVLIKDIAKCEIKVKVTEDEIRTAIKESIEGDS